MKPTLELVEIVARAYDPVGWAWYDAASTDHAAKPAFLANALNRARDAIEAIPVADHSALVVRLRAEAAEDALIAFSDAAELFQEAADALEGKFDGMPEPQGWRSIAEAPRDGTRILIADRYGVCEAVWENINTESDPYKGWAVEHKWWGTSTACDPSHFMPLPAPPKE